MPKLTKPIKMKYLLIVLGFLSFSINAQIYVDKSASGLNDGSSWQDAYQELQLALDTANEGDEIRIAQGNYHPTEIPEVSGGPQITEEKYKCFHLNKDLILKGGFNPITGVQDLTNPTVLSADINEDDILTITNEGFDFSNRSDNTIYVFITADLTANTLIENLTITGAHYEKFGGTTFLYSGYAYRDINGGGMNNHNSSFEMRNVKFIENYGYQGGGVFNTDASPTFKNILFENNKSPFAGAAVYNFNVQGIFKDVTFRNNINTGSGHSGAVYNSSSSPTFENVFFIENKASNGGAMINSGPTNGVKSAPELINNIFYNNSASTMGGAIANFNESAANITNCTFVNNISPEGGAIYNTGKPIIYNTVFFNNHTDIKNAENVEIDPASSNNASDGTYASAIGWMDLTNVSGSAIFIDFNDIAGADAVLGTEDDGLVPLENSTYLINAGLDAANSTTKDIAGQSRFNGQIDIGAYEYGGDLSNRNFQENIYISVYPNPANKDQVIYINSLIKIDKVTLYDYTGNLIFSRNIKNNKVWMDGISSGLYIISLTSEGKSYSRKIIIN